MIEGLLDNRDLHGIHKDVPNFLEESNFRILCIRMVKKTKGLSFDEKKLALSSAMKKEGLFYNLKELEVLGKKNGVIPQAVKEVVDCLVAERVVIQEKIGSLNMYASQIHPSSYLADSGRFTRPVK